MNTRFLKDGLGWGFALWLIGYVLGFVFFMFVPASIIGWVIMPIGVLITLWVLFKRINATSLSYYVRVAIVWTLIAVVFDYLFLVLLLKPAEGYYKLDVYLYYTLMFALPIFVGWLKNSKRPTEINNSLPRT